MPSAWRPLSVVGRWCRDTRRYVNEAFPSRIFRPYRRLTALRAMCNDAMRHCHWSASEIGTKFTLEPCLCGTVFQLEACQRSSVPASVVQQPHPHVSTRVSNRFCPPRTTAMQCRMQEPRCRPQSMIRHSVTPSWELQAKRDTPPFHDFCYVSSS